MQIGKGRMYTPISEDVGSVLKVEVVVIDSSFGVPREAGYVFSVSTTRVKVCHDAPQDFVEVRAPLVTLPQVASPLEQNGIILESVCRECAPPQAARKAQQTVGFYR